MANGKLARYAQKNRELRAENRDLSGQLSAVNGRHTPTTLRKFLGLGIVGGTAYGVGRLYVLAQQKGFMPANVPVDLLLGIGTQGASAFFDGPIPAIAEDVGAGMTGGALGRLAALQQLEATEIAGRQALLLPAPSAANGNGA